MTTNMNNLTALEMVKDEDGNKKYFAYYSFTKKVVVNIAHTIYTGNHSMIGKMNVSRKLKAIRPTTRTHEIDTKVEISQDEAKDIFDAIEVHNIPHRIMMDGRIIEILDEVK